MQPPYVFSTKDLTNWRTFQQTIYPNPQDIPATCIINTFNVPFARTNIFKFSFLPRAIRPWNRLPSFAVNSDLDIAAFEVLVKKMQFSYAVHIYTNLQVALMIKVKWRQARFTFWYISRPWLVLTTTWNDQVWGKVEDASIWRWIFNFLSKHPHYSCQFRFWNVDTHFPCWTTWNNLEIIRITTSSLLIKLPNMEIKHRQSEGYVNENFHFKMAVFILEDV